MTQGPLLSLFERLFGGTAGVAESGSHARQIARLAEGLQSGDARHGELSDDPQQSAVLLAAYLDGGLSDSAQRDVHARLSQSPSALHEIASADSFLNSVSAAREAVPADLIAAALVQHRPATAPRRSVALWKWSGVALAMAAGAIAAVALINRQHLMPADPATPLTAKIAPAPVTEPAQQPPMLAQPQPPEGKPQAPMVARKKTPAPAIAPAASPKTAPQPSTRPAKPQMAPEGFDSMPPQRR
ncbi:MAG: hypothetical protein K2X44_00760 [Magnetospirillum sp.]|nr:hypothetical protein [Magnetospirillum sp.]